MTSPENDAFVEELTKQMYAALDTEKLMQLAHDGDGQLRERAISELNNRMFEYDGNGE